MRKGTAPDLPHVSRILRIVRHLLTTATNPGGTDEALKGVMGVAWLLVLVWLTVLAVATWIALWGVRDKATGARPAWRTRLIERSPAIALLPCSLWFGVWAIVLLYQGEDDLAVLWAAVGTGGLALVTALWFTVQPWWPDEK